MEGEKRREEELTISEPIDNKSDYLLEREKIYAERDQKMVEVNKMISSMFGLRKFGEGKEEPDLLAFNVFLNTAKNKVNLMEKNPKIKLNRNEKMALSIDNVRNSITTEMDESFKVLDDKKL